MSRNLTIPIKWERAAEIARSTVARANASAIFRAAFDELLRRYGHIDGHFSWNCPGKPSLSDSIALQIEETGDRVTANFSLIGHDLRFVQPRWTAAHFQSLLDAAVHAPNTLQTIDILSPEERRLVMAADGESVDVGDVRSLHEAFAEQAACTPNAIAVRYENQKLHYAELNQRANQLARLLRSCGAVQGVPIALSMPRSERMVVAVLGVLKSGNYYVPISCADPIKRRNRIIQASGASFVISDQPIDGLPDTVQNFSIDANYRLFDDLPDSPPDVTVIGSDLAYMLYTSGSTGEPKGVMVEHSQLAGYIAGIKRRFNIQQPRSYALVQPITVGSSITPLGLSLATGGQLHILSYERALDSAAFGGWMQRYEVECLKIAPSFLRALQGSPHFDNILPSWLLIVGGEASPWEWLSALQRANPKMRVINHYGSTETTVGVLTLSVGDYLHTDWDMTPIGTPLPGTTVQVADELGREVPIGIPGELVVSGIQVARGYHAYVGPTGFIQHPDGGRSYRTGDRVRRLNNGTLAFLGRTDDQVKIRGFRVELQEVTTILLQHPDVSDAVTMVSNDSIDGLLLKSYVTPAEVDIVDLTRHLKSRLAPHMMPQTITALDRLPLTPHGKLDRRMLRME